MKAVRPSTAMQSFDVGEPQQLRHRDAEQIGEVTGVIDPDNRKRLSDRGCRFGEPVQRHRNPAPATTCPAPLRPCRHSARRTRKVRVAGPSAAGDGTPAPRVTSGAANRAWRREPVQPDPADRLPSKDPPGMRRPAPPTIAVLRPTRSPFHAATRGESVTASDLSSPGGHRVARSANKCLRRAALPPLLTPG